MAYYHSYHRRRAFKNKPSRSIPQFSIENLAGLPLDDLYKIKRSLESFSSSKLNTAMQIEEINHRNLTIQATNNATRQRNKSAQEDFETRIVKPYQDIVTRVSCQLTAISVGLIKSTWTETFMYNGWRLPKTPEATRLVAEYERLDAGWEQAVWRKRPAGETCAPEIRAKPAPKEYADLTFGGARVRVTFADIDPKRVDDLIALAEAAKNAEKERAKNLLRNLQARAAANELETRALARTYKGNFSYQISMHKYCPYCADALYEANAHLDHIYPVSKGGKSTLSNLVFVCSVCNIKKSNLTLTSFVNAAGLNLSKVHKTLAALAKDF